jgi:hypothetical protein
MVFFFDGGLTKAIRHAASVSYGRGGADHMADIEVQASDKGNAYEFQVTVSEWGNQTRHRVSLSKADYERLTGGQASPEYLVRESFRFLLEREPKESILRSFDLTVISRYFPEYERQVKKRL